MNIERIGKYKIIEEIGRGTMGRVYKAQDSVLNRFVAIKTLSSVSGLADEAHKRFEREAQAAALLGHPNIVTVHDFGEEQGLLYMAMELLDGTDLREVIDRQLLTDLDDKLRVMEQICAALSFAHSKGVIHRDLKPANIHVQPNGQVKIVDFGLARISTSEMTQEGIVLGTPNYMSPEQALGDKVDARSDIFSAGAVFYEILSGHKPFDADSTPGVLFQVVHKEPVSIRQWSPEVPRVLVDVVEKALVKDKKLRFETARQMRAALSIAREAVEGGRGPDASLAEESQRALRAAGNRVDPVFRSSSSASGSGSHPGYVEGTVALDMSPVAKPREGSRSGPSTLSGSAPTQIPRGRSARIRPAPREPGSAVLLGGGALVLLGLAAGGYLLWARSYATAVAVPASPPSTASSEVNALTQALAETQLQLARRDFEDKNYASAASQAERVLKLVPKNAEARKLLDQARSRTREVDASVAQARKALESGNTVEASQALSHVLDLDPRHPAAGELSERLNSVFRSRAEDAARSMKQARTEAERARVTSGDLYTQATGLAKDADALFARSEFASATRAFLESRDAFDRARRAARSPLPAGSPPPAAPTAAPRAAEVAPPLAPPSAIAPPPLAATAAPQIHRFVTAKTIIASRRSSSGLEGFDTADVKQRQMPDFVGHLEFETVPDPPQTGQPFTVRVVLVNEGRKPVRLKAVNLVTTVNGRKAPSVPVPLVREVPPAQRAVVAESKGTWPEDVTSWSLEAVVTSDRDETGTSRLSWN